MSSEAARRSKRIAAAAAFNSSTAEMEEVISSFSNSAESVQTSH